MRTTQTDVQPVSGTQSAQTTSFNTRATTIATNERDCAIRATATMPTTAIMCTNCEDELATHHSDDDLCDDCHDKNYFVCAICGDDYNDLDDQCLAPDMGDTICQSCFDSEYSCCAVCDEYHADSNMAKVARQGHPFGDDLLCPACVSTNTVDCDDCGDTVYSDDSHSLPYIGDVCTKCYDCNYFVCEGCGDTFHNNDCAADDYCEDCYDYDGPDYDPRRCPIDGPTTEVGSGRCYGLEVETNHCEKYSSFEGKTYFGAKEDCTVTGKEFYSSILHGDAGLEAIDKLTEFAKHHNWGVGRSCGTHLHLDLRDDTDDQRYAIAYAYCVTETIFYDFVAANRRTNSYCAPISWRVSDLTHYAKDGHYDHFADSRPRYNWLNLWAFDTHQTIEIRSLEGTLDPTRLKNWVKLHTRFADWASKLGLAGVTKALAETNYQQKKALLLTILGYDLYTYYFKPEKKDDENSNS